MLLSSLLRPARTLVMTVAAAPAFAVTPRARRFGAAIAAVVATASLLFASVPASAATSAPRAALPPRLPLAPVALPADIEAMPSYQPQTFCDPVDKPGPVAFGALLTATYPDTSVVDISRPCGSEAGTSEHKDGRALDWGADYNNPRQVAEVKAVFSWLFAPDAQGNPNAMLRRLGIMYIIWNRQIWGTWSSSWQPYSCSGVTACHQDHVHFSFDWAGARKRTSFWTGVVAAPMPAPVYVYANASFAQGVTVAARRRVVTTPFSVRAGVPYRITVTGTYRYTAATTSRADAECATTDGRTWRALAPGETSPAAGALDLWINGHRSWRPTVAAVAGCNTGTHTYTRTLRFASTGPLQMWLADPTRADDAGSLRVSIQRV